jgi:hypothetical protein
MCTAGSPGEPLPEYDPDRTTLTERAYAAGTFVAWAVRSKVASGISIPTRAHRVSYRPLDADERWKIARQLLNDDSFETKDRRCTRTCSPRRTR